MTVKDKLLTVFEEQKGVFLSGEELAERLSVSRTAIWKAVNALRSDGYEIEAGTNKGYRLSADSDILSEQGIRSVLGGDGAELSLHVYSSVSGSTNDLVKQQAENGEKEGFTVIAGAQTGGKGRAGRSFFSPPDTGIYLSLLLRPEHYTADQAVRITTMAAVSACEAIETVSDCQAQIKWVNDIYIAGKKVSGILTEASFDLETLLLSYAVLGIGFNVYPPEGGFPEEIQGRAGSILQGKSDNAKNRLAAEFLRRFLFYYRLDDTAEYIRHYQERSFVPGNPVTVISPAGEKNAVAETVDDLCRLVVRYEDGSTEALSSGEISIRI